MMHSLRNNFNWSPCDDLLVPVNHILCFVATLSAQSTCGLGYTLSNEEFLHILDLFNSQI